MDEEHTEPTQKLDDDADAGSFWQRMFGAKEKERRRVDDDPTTSPAPETNKPRKRQKTIFDKAEDQQKRRYAKAALMRRERLASAISEKVEEVINHRMVTGEERLAEVGESFSEMNVLLGAIGRNLDGQSRCAQHMADTLDALPVAAEKERVVLEAIAKKLEGQAESVQGVPEVVSLVRQGSKVSAERLLVLRGLKHELSLQREQQSAVLGVLRKSSRQFEERMTALEETMAKSMVEARSDATSLRSAIQQNTEELIGEAGKEAKRNGDLLQSLQVVSSQLVEGNALSTASALSHEKEVMLTRNAQQRMAGLVANAQSNTLSEMQRFHEQAREREEELARRNRLTLIGSSGFLGIFAAAFLALQAPAPAPEPIFIPVRSAAAPVPQPTKKIDKEQTKTLPASMPREDAKRD